MLVLGALLQNDLYRQTEGWVCPSGEERWVSVSSSCVFLAEHSGRPSLPTAFCPARHGPVIITHPCLATFPFILSCTFHLCCRGSWCRFIEVILWSESELKHSWGGWETIVRWGLGNLEPIRWQLGGNLGNPVAVKPSLTSSRMWRPMDTKHAPWTVFAQRISAGSHSGLVHWLRSASLHVSMRGIRKARLGFL